MRSEGARALDHLGTCHAPHPVELGDVVALEHGPPLRVVDVLVVPPRALCVPVLVEPAKIVVTS